MAFRPGSSYALAPNGEIYYGFSDRYEIRIFSADGKPVRIIRKEYDPLPVKEPDKVVFAETMKSEFLRSLPPGFETAKMKAIQMIEYPKFKPAYKDLIVDDEGRLIVVVAEEKNSAFLDIFDLNGRWIMRTRAEIPTESLCFRGGKAYAVAVIDDYRYVKRDMQSPKKPASDDASRDRRNRQDDRSPGGPLCRDPNDDFLIEAALAGNAGFLVTGDKALLSLIKFRSISILEPAAFIASVEKR